MTRRSSSKSSFKSCPRVGGIEVDGVAGPAVEVSSRAPVWGASTVHGQLHPREKFQVVPPCGGHLPPLSLYRVSVNVSSRAPVWGASPPRAGHLWPARSFKSCPRVGGILEGRRKAAVRKGFQVVPPCGGHPPSLTLQVQGNVFQVVPPCGGHPTASPSGSRYESFKSCPRVGGILCPRYWRRTWTFQVVPPCGGHPGKRLASVSRSVFQVVPPCGGHHDLQLHARRRASFKSCPRVGGISSGSTRPA